MNMNKEQNSPKQKVKYNNKTNKKFGQILYFSWYDRMRLSGLLNIFWTLSHEHVIQIDERRLLYLFSNFWRVTNI